jgi:predicted secreted hydrolase
MLLLAPALALPLARGDGGAGFDRHYPYVAGPFTFPRDEGPHTDVLGLEGNVLGPAPGYGIIEWWYIVAHMQASDGHRFAMMDSFLDFGSLTPVSREMIFDITDVTGQAFYPSDVMDHSVNLSAPPAKTDLTVAGVNRLVQPEGEPFVYELTARGPDAGADLRFVADRAPFLPNGGVVVMGPLDTAVSRSGYYTLPSLRITGSLTVHGVRYEVTGRAALDHEWYVYCSCLKNDWDYFNIQLDNGAYVVAYVFFDTNLAPTYRYDALLPDGTGVGRDAFGFDVLGQWQKHPLDLGDPGSLPQQLGSKLYSHGWRFRLDDAGLDITLRPTVEDQEAHRGDLPENFYEGEADVTGTFQGGPVHGLAFAEIWHDSRLDLPPSLP